jgi:ubiquitin-like-specific protease 1C/D
VKIFFSFVINTTHVNSDNPEAVELSSSDIKCLNPGVYVSSPVINYYIQLRICIPIFKFYFMSFYDLLFLETA